MSIYSGMRTASGVEVLIDGKKLPLRLDLANHSPTGFEYGYGGSGPAQLALAILIEPLAKKLGYASEKLAAPDWIAVQLHQKFKFSVVAKLQGNDWTLTSDQVDAAISTLVQ